MKKFLFLAKILKKIIFFVSIAALILAVIVAVTTRFSIPGGFRVYSVLTGSMQPTISTGSLIFTKIPLSSKEIQKDQIITFEQPGFENKFVTHRVHQVIEEKESRFFATKGDANNKPDFWLISYGRIKGVYRKHIPYVGYILEFIKSPFGIILFVIVPVVVLAIGELKNIVAILSEMKLQKERKDAKTGGQKKKVKKKEKILLAIAIITLFLSFQTQGTLALFSPESVSVAGISLQTAAMFPSPPETTLTIDDGYVVSEQVGNESFESGGSIADWIERGDVDRLTSDFETNPKEGGWMTKIGGATDLGREIWLNGLGQSIAFGAKNLSFWYNFYTYDDIGGDEPGFSLKINNIPVFNLWASDVWDYYSGDDDLAGTANTGWQQMCVDLTQFESPYLGVSFYGGNTDWVLDEYYDQSWVYLDKVTTTEVMADENTEFHLSTESGATIYYQVQENDDSWQEEDWQELDGEFFTLSGSEYPSGNYTIYYRAIDSAGNSEAPNILKVHLDNEEPTPILISSLTATPFVYSVKLLWDVPDDNGKRAASYDIRYWEGNVCNVSDWDSAISIPFPPVPRFPGELQDFEITGLEPEASYCFAMKACDAALNCSDISDVVFATTLPEEEPPIGILPGYVVINELMWMGSKGYPNDEWIELRNTTPVDIDLSGWQITKWVAGDQKELMLTIPEGEILPANGYFLIANFNKSTSKINVKPDLVDTSVVLVNSDLQIKLYDGDWETTGVLIDTADDSSGTPAAGNLGNKWSMERNDEPGDGTDLNNWHTCEDALTTIESWDGGATEQGTPGGANRSVDNNKEPVLNLFLRKDKKAVGFKVENIADYQTLKYEIVYDTADGDKGIMGSIEIDGQDTILRENLVLGTCSGIEGKVCAYDQGITKITLKATLVNQLGEGKILQKEIDY